MEIIRIMRSYQNSKPKQSWLLEGLQRSVTAQRCRDSNPPTHPFPPHLHSTQVFGLSKKQIHFEK